MTSAKFVPSSASLRASVLELSASALATTSARARRCGSKAALGSVQVALGETGAMKQRPGVRAALAQGRNGAFDREPRHRRQRLPDRARGHGPRPPERVSCATDARTSSAIRSARTGAANRRRRPLRQCGAPARTAEIPICTRANSSPIHRHLNKWSLNQYWRESVKGSRLLAQSPRARLSRPPPSLPCNVKCET